MSVAGRTEIRFLSGLHREASGRRLTQKDTRFERPVGKDDRRRILVLAGDIHVGVRVCDSARRVARHFRAVVLVPGNHEYYKAAFRELAKRLAARVGGSKPAGVANSSLRFIGATLWADFRHGYPFAMRAPETG